MREMRHPLDVAWCLAGDAIDAARRTSAHSHATRLHAAKRGGHVDRGMLKQLVAKHLADQTLPVPVARQMLRRYRAGSVAELRAVHLDDFGCMLAGWLAVNIARRNA